MLPQAVQEPGIPAGAFQHQRQLRGVTQRKIAFVVTAQHADVARDAAGQHRHATGDGLDDHVGAAFHGAGDHHGLCFPDVLQGFVMGQVSEPDIAPHAGPGSCFQRQGLLPIGVIQRAADVDQAHARIVGKQRERAHGRQRVFFRPHVAHQYDVEVILAGRRGRACRGRLVDHPAPGAMRGRQFGQPFVLQHHQVGGEFERALGRCIGADVAVQIGAGQHDDQRTIRTSLGKPGDGLGRAPGVQGDQAVGQGAALAGRRPFSGQRDIVVPLQEPGPAIGGLPVAIVGFAQRWTDNRDGGLGRTHDDRF
ncbi:hypothetical protein D3C72_1393400 [compost metagenome]